MKDWNDFMTDWDGYHRVNICAYMRSANYIQRREVNLLLKDMSSSLKWCRFDDCVNIWKKLHKIIKSNAEHS